jgi:hypothetical protein
MALWHAGGNRCVSLPALDAVSACWRSEGSDMDGDRTFDDLGAASLTLAAVSLAHSFFDRRVV